MILAIKNGKEVLISEMELSKKSVYSKIEEMVVD